ncbi:hypothetical protein KCP71_01875 [Salmonella enterica subsp. enterica]|nr:hypothetical protein KCP71_01875 [Salmonella enterica subsp. enterica]
MYIYDPTEAPPERADLRRRFHIICLRFPPPRVSWMMTRQYHCARWRYRYRAYGVKSLLVPDKA